MAWISPTSTATVDVRPIAGSVPPWPVFDVQSIASSTVAETSNVPLGWPADEDVYV
jgi:hypothetical protein